MGSSASGNARRGPSSRSSQAMDAPSVGPSSRPAKETEVEVPETKGPRRFLALPAEEVGFLKSTLQLYVAWPRVEEILRLHGRRLGRSIATLDPEAIEVGSIVCRLAAQVGLGKVSLTDVAPEAWTLRLERLAEPMHAAPAGAWPIFTAGVLEGIFEGLLGNRVKGELHARPPDGWELTVSLLPMGDANLGGTARFRLPGARAYRLEEPEGT